MESKIRRRTDRLTYGELPAVARTFVATICALGALTLAVSVNRISLSDPVLFVLLGALAILASVAKIELPLGRSDSNLSLSQAVNFWAMFALGGEPAVCIAAASGIAQCTLRTTTGAQLPHRVIFSIASLTITVALASTAFGLTQVSGTGHVIHLVRGAAVVAPLYFLLNTWLIATAIALSTRQPLVPFWRRNFLWSAPSYLAGAALAAAATAAWQRGFFEWLVILGVPMYLVFRSYHSIVARLREEQNETRRAMDVQLATIEALALAIEAKAGCTPEHVRSIQQYAAMLADAAGMSDLDIQAVRTAALLHDVGNLAVPEHILAKPGPLTPEEFERIKIHPRVGADILRDIPFNTPVVDYVLCHHERWDGLGYPAGLRGEEIPLGARVLAIADTYSTLQTERPYRPARTEQAAATVLRQLAGAAYDPRLVDLMLARLHSEPVSTESVSRAAKDNHVLQDISDAHREEQILYAIAQALGSRLGVDEAMQLICDKVNRLVPFETCALFLGDEEHGFVCRYANGPGTEALLKWTPKSWSELSLRVPSCADGRGGRGHELTSLLPCRLSFEGRMIGALVIYHTVSGCFTDEHRRVLVRVSEQAAAVIANSTRYEQTRHESQTDVLTALPNRRSFDRQLTAGLARAIQERTSASLVVLDLDRLKEINDTFGHEAGDRALQAVGAVLRATVRENDLCARFAGDEFVVVLWDCNEANEARRVIELQEAVSAHPFEPRPGVRVQLSISAGCARFPDDGRTFDQLLVAGDERMYQDKASRRSRHAGRARATDHQTAERA